MRDGRIEMPTGRVYKFEPEVKYGKVKFPRTKILNYPVQGLGADLMALARVSLRNRLKDKEGVLMVNTVHDSIILDVDINKISCYNISKIVNDCFTDVPKNFHKLFGQEFNLPMRVEIQVGPNWKDMEVYEVGNG
jgi:DNA polymerase I-like protein with 3'-5' exonuclease and polymerase domains